MESTFNVFWPKLTHRDSRLCSRPYHVPRVRGTWCSPYIVWVQIKDCAMNGGREERQTVRERERERMKNNVNCTDGQRDSA